MSATSESENCIYFTLITYKLFQAFFSFNADNYKLELKKQKNINIKIFHFKFEEISIQCKYYKTLQYTQSQSCGRLLSWHLSRRHSLWRVSHKRSLLKRLVDHRVLYPSKFMNSWLKCCRKKRTSKKGDNIVK